MSAYWNKATIMGNVGRDPHVSCTTKGTLKAQFSVATNHRHTTQSGEVREETEWHQIVAWGKQAELVQKYVRKGSHVLVEGRLKTNSWVDEESKKRVYKTEIHAVNCLFLNRMVDTSSETEGEAPKRARTKSQQMLELEGAGSDDDFELAEMTE